MKQFLTVCLNPTIQKTLVFNDLKTGEVNRYSEHYLTASGKGINVSRVLRQLGRDVVHLTHTGGTFGPVFLRLARRDGIKIVSADSKSETRICTTLLDSGANVTTELVEEPEPVSEKTETRIRHLFKREIKNAHTLVISGSKAGGYSDDIFPWMVKTAKERGVRIILDLRGADLVNCLPFFPDVIKPNSDELRDTLQLSPDLDKGDIEKTLLALAAAYHTVPVITSGSAAVLFTENGTLEQIVPEKIVPANTTGCGDSFSAGYAAAMHENSPVRNCIREGLRCAGLNALNRLPGNIL